MTLTETMNGTRRDVRAWLLEGDHPVHVLLGLALAVFVAAYTLTAFYKYDSFQMGFDLGVYEQVIWNTLHGRWFESSVFSYTANHLGSDPILIEALLAPFYAVYPSPYTLFVLQTLATAVGAFGIYLLAVNKIKKAWIALVLTLAYLAYVPLGFLVLYEFQPRLFAIAFLIFAFYFMEQGRFRPFMLMVLLSLTTRSDVALILGMLGLYALVERKGWKFVIPPILLGALWFFIALFVIVPHFRYGGGAYVYADAYSWLGKTPGEMVMTALTRPLYVLENVFSQAKLLYLLGMFLPFALTPLLKPKILLIAAPTFAINLLSPYRVNWDVRNAYTALIIPFTAIAAVYAVAQFGEWAQRLRFAPNWAARIVPLAAGVVLLASLLLNLGFNSAANPVATFLSRKMEPPRLAAVQSILAQIPPEAHIAANSFLAPHLAQRQYLYFFPPHKYYTSDPLGQADYIFVDLQFDGGDSQQQALVTLNKGGDWEKLANLQGFVLYHKKGK